MDGQNNLRQNKLTQSSKIIWAIVIFVIATVLASVYFWQEFDLKNTNWQSFQHDGWGYVIKYPSNLYIKESPQGDKFPGDISTCPMCGSGGQTLIISDLEKMGIQDVMPNEKIHITISTSKKEKDNSLYEHLSELTKNTSNISSTTVNNMPCYRIASDKHPTISIWLVKSEESEWIYNLHGINYLNRTLTSENFELMMNIINTFEFVE